LTVVDCDPASCIAECECEGATNSSACTGYECYFSVWIHTAKCLVCGLCLRLMLTIGAYDWRTWLKNSSRVEGFFLNVPLTALVVMVVLGLRTPLMAVQR